MKRILVALLFVILASLLFPSLALAWDPFSEKSNDPFSKPSSDPYPRLQPRMDIEKTIEEMRKGIPGYGSYGQSPSYSYSPPSYSPPSYSPPSYSYSNRDVDVRGYYRSNGTYVKPYSRTRPDSNPYNNYSYPGNYNPNTGKYSTGSTDSYLKRYYKR